MDYWNVSNRQFSESLALHRVMGYLEAFKGKNIEADKLLNYIHNTANEIETNLNNKFPNKKEVLRCPLE